MVVVLFSEVQPVCPVPTGDGGYYPLYWCAREAKESRSARTHVLYYRSEAVRRDPRAAPRAARARLYIHTVLTKAVLRGCRETVPCSTVLQNPPVSIYVHKN